MNSQLKKRLIITTIAIIAVVLGVAFFIGSSSTAKTVSVAEATSGELGNAKIQVEGKVVDNSYAMSGNTLTFRISDASDPTSGELWVSYQGAVSSTFGNGVSAICTGKIDDQGVLQASELVTKCPSKYEDSSNALSVSKLLSYGESIYDKTVKVVGVVGSDGIKITETMKSFTLLDAQDSSIQGMKVSFQGALSDDIDAGKTVVITGSLTTSGVFNATDVSLEK